MQTIEWDRGHVIGQYDVTRPTGMMERLVIATTNLKIDDSKFELAPTT